MAHESSAQLEKLKEIDKKAARERAGVTFIFNLLAADADKIQEAFQTTEEDEELRQAYLFDKTSEALDWLATHSTRVIGVNLSYLTPEDPRKVTHPYVTLGWAVYVPALKGIEECDPDDYFPHVLSPTEEGVEIVNAYREALGLVSVQEQRQYNRDRLL